MAHALTEASTFDATVTVPDDADTRNAASVATGFQNLANRTRYLTDNKLPVNPTTGSVSITSGSTNNLTVSGATQLAACTTFGLLTCDAGISVLAGTISTGGAGTIGNCTVSGVLNMASTGMVRYRQATAPNSDHTYAVADCDTVIIPGAGISGSHNYTFSATGAVNGLRMRIVNWDSHTHAIKKSDGGVVATISAAAVVAGSGIPGFVELEWYPNGVIVGSDWLPVAFR